MSLKRKLLMSLAAASLPIGTGVVLLATAGTATAAAPVFADSTPPPAGDTVTCNTALGFFKIAPALVAGGTAPAKVVIKATLEGCVDGFGAVNGGLPFYGIASGLLRTSSNNITNLSGANALGCLHGNGYVHLSAVIQCGWSVDRVDSGVNTVTGSDQIHDTTATVADVGKAIGSSAFPAAVAGSGGAAGTGGAWVNAVSGGFITVSSSPSSLVPDNAIATKTGTSITLYSYQPSNEFSSPTNPFGDLTVQWANGRTLALSSATYGGEISIPTCTYGNSDAIDGFGDFSNAAGGYTDGAYGEFVVGHEALAPPTNPTHGCTTPETTSNQGGFDGGDSGANSSLVALTANDATSLLFGQENPSAAVSQITLGPTAVFFG